MPNFVYEKCGREDETHSVYSYSPVTDKRLFQILLITFEISLRSRLFLQL